jgi:hypothetical protein
MKDKMNVLNENFDFMRLTDFKLLNPAKGVSVNDCGVF